MGESNYNQPKRQSPLCVFCLSPTFSLRTCVRPGRKTTGHPLPPALSWRRPGYSMPRFKITNRRNMNPLNRFTTGFRRRKTLKLDEILDILKEVWKSPQDKSSFSEMERKSTSYSNDIPSPVLLRRRLSAPETIMRKHVLAQQRSDDITQNDTRNSQWRMENAAESDPNLNKKRDSGLMRKSTLLRRLWSNSKPLSGTRFSGSFYEWQHSFGKMSSSNSLTTSNHSSPEHKSQSRRSSPQHFQRKLSPSPSKMMSPKRKVSVYNGNYEYTSYSSNSATDNSNISSSLDNRTSRTITPKTESENYSTRSTTTSYTTFSENSDSAITNSHYSNNNSTTSSEITKQFIEESDNSNQEANQTTTTKETAKNINSSPKSESGTQTSDMTNLNVISNVQLSQSTLDLIFQQVIQDVNKTSPHVDTTPVSDVKKVIQVQEIPSFYLKRKEDITVDDQQHQRIVKYMISNIGTGSPYSKPAEVPQVVVPRFSAQPRSSSMEVNTSSGESDDKESDTVSLVDSLEDPHSPRVNNISPMLPDNSNKIRKLPKPSTFFIPMESNQVELKAVSDLLPDKVREKLNKRQQKLHEKSKLSSPRSDSNYISASDNQLHFVAHDSSDLNVKSTPVLPQVNYKKKRNKPLLPSIESIRKTKIDKREKDPKLKVKRKSIPKEDLQQSKSKNWMPKPRNKMNEKLTPIYTSKNEYVYNAEPRRIYHKTEFSNNNKRIEILEIMECVETPEKNHIFKGKSKIPVLVNQKLPKINDGSHKPSFLDFDQVEASDPKLDQLIANILIDTLNNSAESPKNKNERKSSGSPTKYNNAKYQQKFDVIPEELQSLEDNLLRTDIRNNNNTENNYEATSSETDNPTYKGKAAVAVVRDENFSTIPKGWITFYMLHKNQGTPDSTSDEGKNKFDQNDLKEIDKRISSDKDKIAKIDESLKGSFSSSEDLSQLLPMSGKPKRNSSNQAKTYNVNNDKGEWSVTVSGTNSYGQMAPELEMRLKFPKNDSGLNKEKPTGSYQRWLPEIPKNKLTKKTPDQIPFIIEPRQNKTSTRRYQLTRPKNRCHDILPQGSIFNEREYADFLRHFPDILTVHGRTISPDRSRVPSLSERDLIRHFYTTPR